MSATDAGRYTGQWDYATLPANIRLGDDCFLEDKGSFRRFRSEHHPGLVLGNRVRVFNWTAFTTEPSGVIIVGDDTVLVGAIFWCAGWVEIGQRVTISYNVMIADSDFHPLDPDLRRQDAIAVSPEGDISQRPPLVTRPVIIDDDVQVGINAMILKGVRIGRGARVGPGAVVTADVPAGATVLGNPARPVSPEALA